MSGVSEKTIQRWDPAEYEAETGSDKLKRKAKEDPFVPVGILGCIAAVGYGAITYKRHRRQGMSTSIFLMKFRVVAQSMVVGAMTLGVCYSLYKQFSGKPEIEFQKK
ncbi:HIG1 domain family member 1A, mitochondrial-like [Ptychodera flava]|uniref:HIG1 domain family member 1A, mitochondrial-like n=1 Tax=Ptychodera flava TaxID=63121 RepID=UPI00396A331F